MNLKEIREILDLLKGSEVFRFDGADMITFHLAGASQPHRVLQVLRDATNANDPARGIIRGVGVNPSTPLEALEPLLDEVDYVLILAINPGWGGQGFLASTERRLARARAMIAASGRQILLGVDGGVTRSNIAQVAAMGADVIVTGSAVFDGKAPVENLRFMMDAVAGRRASTTAGCTKSARIE